MRCARDRIATAGVLLSETFIDGMQRAVEYQDHTKPTVYDRGSALSVDALPRISEH